MTLGQVTQLVITQRDIDSNSPKLLPHAVHGNSASSGLRVRECLGAIGVSQCILDKADHVAEIKNASRAI